jgi:hypothetical protein
LPEGIGTVKVLIFPVVNKFDARPKTRLSVLRSRPPTGAFAKKEPITMTDHVFDAK